MFHSLCHLTFELLLETQGTITVNPLVIRMEILFEHPTLISEIISLAIRFVIIIPLNNVKSVQRLIPNPD